MICKVNINSITTKISTRTRKAIREGKTQPEVFSAVFDAIFHDMTEANDYGLSTLLSEDPDADSWDLLTNVGHRVNTLLAAKNLDTSMDVKEIFTSLLEAKLNVEPTATEAAPVQTEDAEVTVATNISIDAEEQTITQKFSDSEAALQKNSVPTFVAALKNYLVGPLANNPEALGTYFFDIINRSWLSTNTNNDSSFEFDAKKVRTRIKNNLAATIRNYYTRNASIIYSIAGLNSANPYSAAKNNLVVYSDITKIPTTAAKIADVDGAQFFIDESVLGEDGNPIILAIAPADGIKMATLETFRAEYIAEESVLDLYSTIEGENNGLPRIDKNTIQEHYESPELVSAYYAQTLLNELDLFIASYVKPLTSTFVDTVRTGSVENDVIGSDMANKMTKLNIISTPMLYADINTEQSFTEVTKLTTDVEASKTPIDTITNSPLVDELDRTGSKVLTYAANGKHYTGLVFNIGGNRTLLLFDGKSWGYPTIKENGALILNESSDIDGRGNQNHYHQSAVIELLNMLENTVGTAVGVANLRSMQTSKIIKSDLQAMLKTVNQEVAADTTQHALRISSSEKKYLYEAELEIASELLHQIPNNKKGARAFLITAMNDEGSIHRDIARSLYYRFFHEGSYKITELNPITGLIETVVHKSMWEQAEMSDNNVAEMAATALHSYIRTVTLDNKSLYKNGRFNSSAVQTGTSVYGVINAIDYGNTISNGSRRKTKPSGFEKFKITNTSKGKYKIEYRQTVNAKAADATIFIEETSNSGTVHGSKFRVVTDNGEPYQLTRLMAASMSEALGIPHTLSTESFWQQYAEEAKVFNPSADASTNYVGDFFVNILTLKLANGSDIPGNNNFSKSGANSLNMVSSESSAVEYTFKDNMWGTKAALDATLEKTNGSSKRTVVLDAEGNKRAISTIGSKSKRKSELVEDAKIKMRTQTNVPTSKIDYLYKYSAFLTDTDIASNEMWVPDTETLKFYGSGTSKLGILQGDEGKANSNLSRAEQVKYLISGAFLTTAAENGFQYALFQPGTMSDRSFVGMSAVGYSSPERQLMPVDKNGRLDEIALRTEYFKTQRNAMRGINDSAMIRWKDALKTVGVEIDVDAIADIAQLHKVLSGLNLNYDILAQQSNLTNELHLVKDSNGNANIKYTTVQMYQLTMDEGEKADNRRELYLNTNLELFKAYLKDNDFTSLDGTAQDQLADRFSGVGRQDLYDVLVAGFFYHDSIVEQETIQFGTGSIFQYGTKLPSLFETLIGTSDEKLVQIKNKLFKENISYEALSLQGAKGNMLGFIKSVLENDSMSADAKIVALEFNDINSQLSQQYVARVKRNQGDGTGVMSYIMASEGESGFYMDDSSKVLLFADPAKKLKILNSGEINQEINDAASMVHPLFMYKHNNSIGNKFSNFRSRGITKTVNISNASHGGTIYEKRADMPHFGWEFEISGTPEHRRLMRFMNESVKFSADGSPITMWLEEDLLSELKDWKPIDNATEVLLQQGESLGEVIADGKLISARQLLKLERQTPGYIASLGVIQTTKVPVQISNLQELYDHFGGTDTEIKVLNTADNKQSLVEEFPYGWVWKNIGDIITSFRGDGTYPLRNSYISKAGFVSQNKTGQEHINPASAITDRLFDINTLKYSDISNKYAGPVLVADAHNGDTTSDYSMTEEAHSDTISMVRQVLGAGAAQGESTKTVSNIFDALAALSDTQLAIVRDDIKTIKSYNDLTEKEAVKQYVLDLAQNKLATGNDPGLTGEFLGTAAVRAGKVSFDIKQLNPLVRSAVNAHMDKKVIRNPLSGGQYIISNNHDQVKTYTFNGVSGLFRASNGLLSNNETKSSTSINEVIRDFIIVEGVEALPNDWALTAVTTEEDLFNQHNDNDLVYVTDTTDKTSELTAVRLKDLLKNKQDYQLFNAEGKYIISSPWLNNHENSKSNGDDLQWINYFKNGKSVYDTDEFHSYFLAGKAPKVIKGFSEQFEGEELIQKVQEFFQQETGGVIPPAGLIAKFMYSEQGPLANAELALSPVLGSSHLTTATAAFDTSAMHGFINYMASQSAEVKAFTAQFKPQLEYEMQQDGWTTKEAEFYMPPHHQTAFLMDYGDTMAMIKGAVVEPDYVSLHGIISKADIDLFYTAWSSMEAVNLRKKLSKELEDVDKVIFDKFINARVEQQRHMLLYFSTKIKNVQALSTKPRLSSVERRGLTKRAPIFLLNTVKTESKKKELLQGLLASKDVINNPAVHQELLDLLTAINDSKRITSTSTLIETATNKFISTWSNSLADNFDKSLTFISARIPAQGKQSATAGKIKNFIYSSRNAIYGPLEMLAITGADYDIDKQNNMTWDVDVFGSIIKLDPKYIKNNEVDLATFNADNITTTRAYKKKLEEQGLPAETIAQILKAKTAAKLDLLARGLQNYVVSNLIDIAKDPKNALEAATAVAMNKLKDIGDYLDSFNFSELEIKNYGIEKNAEGKIVFNKALSKALTARQLAMPFAPHTKMDYERINMDGKTGVGIFASALKSYLAIYHAFVTNESVEQFNERMNTAFGGDVQLNDILNNIAAKNAEFSQSTEEDAKNIKFSNPFAEKLRTAKLDIKDDAFHFIWKDAKTGLFRLKNDIFSVANSNKHMPSKGAVYSKLHSTIAKSAFKQLQFTTNETEQTEILSTYMESFKLNDEFDKEPQAWEDLSELLSAATDNAKELLLSKIGADNNTSSIISAMVVLGIDLQAALSVINDPVIKEVIAKVELNNRLDGEVRESQPSMTKLLEAAVKTYSTGNNRLNDEALKQLVISEIVTLKLPADEANKQFEIMFKKQKALRDAYNPAQQIAWYSGVSEELTKISSILGVSGGMKNNEIDVFNFTLSTEAAIGVRTGSKKNKRLIDFTGGTVIDSKGDPIAITAAQLKETQKKIIQDYNKVKVAFNIPYVILKNPHTLSYLRGLVESTSMLSKISFTTRFIYEDLIRSMPKNKTYLKPYELSTYVNTVMGVAIDKFFEDKAPKLIIGQKEYDLTIVQDKEDSTRQGRLQFIKDMPDILQKRMQENPALRNKLLERISNVGDPEVDPTTGEEMFYLRGINTGTIREDDLAVFKNTLRIVKEIDPELHNALFKYSLIINKGGLGSDSIASLFELSDYAELESYFVELEASEKFSHLIQSMNSNVKAILNPALLESFSTQAGTKNLQYIKSNNDEQDGSEPYEELNEPEIDINEDDANNKIDYDKIASDKFDLTSMNRLKRDQKAVPDVWKSMTNGLMYAWHKDLNSYVPITLDVPTKIINFKLTPETTIEDLFGLGYNWGWKIQFSDMSYGRVLIKKKAIGEVFEVLRHGNLGQLKLSAFKPFNEQLKFKNKSITINRLKYENLTPFSFYKDAEGNVFRENADGRSSVYIESTDMRTAEQEDSALLSDSLKILIKKTSYTPADIPKILVAFQDLAPELEIEAYKLLYPDGIGSRDLDKDLAELASQETDLNGLRTKISQLSSAGKYGLLRASAAQRYAFITNNLATEIESYPKEWKAARGSLSNKYVNNGKILNNADLTLITSEDYVKGLTHSQYLFYLNKLNITPDIYRKQIGLDVLTLNGKVLLDQAKLKTTPIVKASKIEQPIAIKSKMVKDLSPEVMSKLGTFLNKRFKNSTVRTLSTIDIIEQYGEDFKNLVGFMIDGVVVLNHDKADLRTALHEFGHLYLAELKETDIDLYDRLMQLASKSPLITQTKKLYKNLSETDLAEEVFVELLGRNNSSDLDAMLSEELDNEAGKFGKVKMFFKDLFSGFFGTAKKKSLDIKLTDTLTDVINKVGIDMIFNENSGLHGLSSYKQKTLRQVGSGTLTQSEALAILKDNGYISKLCV